MRTLYLSYAAGDQSTALGLADGLGQAGYLVRMDRQLAGDAAWWTGVLTAIQEADAFLLVMTHAALSSPACLHGREHAVAVGLPVLLVRCQAGAAPPWQGDRQTDFLAGDAAGAFRLIGAIAALPARATPAAGHAPPPETPLGFASWSAPSSGAPGWNGPSSGAPGWSAPSSGAPGWSAPSSGAPGWTAPSSGAPGWSAGPGTPGSSAGPGTPGSSAGPGTPGWNAGQGTPGWNAGSGAQPWNVPADAVNRDMPPGTLTETAVRDVAFSKPSIFRTGYEEHSVDEFLDLVEADLRARRAAIIEPVHGGPLLVALTPGDVQAVQFRQAAGRHAYDEAEVDSFLEEVRRSFAALDAELHRRGRYVAKR